MWKQSKMFGFWGIHSCMKCSTHSVPWRYGTTPGYRLKSEPYLHQYYNAKAIHESSPLTRGNTLGKKLNGLITKMNDCEHLPHFLILIPDGDLVHAMNHFEYGASTIIGRCLEWLINQIDQAITARKSGLQLKGPGWWLTCSPRSSG